MQQYSATVVSSTATAGAVAAVNNNQVQYPEIHSSTANAHLRQPLDMPQMNSSLSVEQSQYFNSLTSQNSNQQAAINAYQHQVPVSVQYPVAGYGATNSYVEQVVSSQQPPVRKQRARVPPPSKIPSTAVEMPGDTLNNIGYLDVQFGGLDFGTEETFDTISEKFNSIENSQNVSVSDVSNDSQNKSYVSQNSALSSSLQASQMLPNADSLSSSQNDSLSANYNQRTSNSVQQQPGSVVNAINSNAGEFNFIFIFILFKLLLIKFL